MEIHLKVRRNLPAYLFISMLALVCSADTVLAQDNTIAVSPSSLVFTAANGTPSPQFLTVTSGNAGGTTFTATVSAGSNFINVFQSTSMATPSSSNNVQVAISNPNMPNGTYQGLITIVGPVNQVQASVTYNVGINQTNGVTASLATLTFNVPKGAPTTVQHDTLMTSGNPINISISTTMLTGTGWLGATPTTATVAPTTPVIVTASVNPTTLAPGSYQGSINVYQLNTQVLLAQIPVYLNVGQNGGSALAASPTSLSYSFSNGSTTQQNQTLQITTNSNLVEQVTATPVSAGWLFVNGSTNAATISIQISSPANLSIGVNPTSLTTGTYTGSINLVSANLGNLTVQVTVNVGQGTGTELTATPNPIIFSIPSNSTQQVFNQNVSITTQAQQVVYTATPATTTGGNWLSVNPSAPQTVTNGSPDTLQISAVPGTLTAGTYNGTITLTPQDGSGALVVPVNMNIGSAPTLTASPTSLSFAYQAGTAFPAPQTLALTSSGIALGYSVTSSTQGGNWLVISPLSGSTGNSGGPPTNLTVQVNPSGLQPATYSGTITITAPGASNPTVSVNVSLLVSSLPIITLGAEQLTFSYEFGTTTLPAPQQVLVSSSGNQLGFTAAAAPSNGGNFLTVSPTNGTTPESISLSINPAALASLAPGTYGSTVTVSAPGSGNTPVNLPVALVIGNNTLFNTSQTSMTFNYQIGEPLPPLQRLDVTSTGPPLNYNVTVAASNCGGNFLTAAPNSGTTPGNVAIGINATGLVAGTCNGSITITSTVAGVGNSPLVIPVTLNVSKTPLLNVSPGALNVSAQVGSSPVSQTLSLTSTDPATALGFNVTSTTTTGSGWLLVGPTSGSTPIDLTVGFQTAGLAVGTYSGSITVTPTATGSIPTVIPVIVVITSATSASATPSSLNFAQSFKGPAPAAQTLQIASTTSGLSFAATATTFNGGSWFSVTPSNGTTPGTLTVTANGATLGQGTYTGVITIVIPGAGNTPLNVQVTLVIGPPQSVSLSVNSLAFTYQSGGTAPAAQSVQVTGTGGNVAFTATAASATNGLVVVTPTSSTTPASLAISLNPTVLATLAVGTYTGSVTVSSSNLPGASQTVNVSVTVQAALPPVVNSVVNGASNLPGAVSPGEIITIYGTNIGPATAAGLQLTTGGTVATTLANTEVTFDNIPAPLIYVSANQINAIVPYEMAGRATATVVVERNSVASVSVQLNVANTSPAIFSLSMTGSGQGAILNQNNTVNGSANPAAAGSAIAIYATGEGVLTPQPPTGSVTSSTGPTFPKPNAGVSLTIGGQTAQILYAGEAPGLVSGVLQVNAVIPAGLATGPQQVILTIGSGSDALQNITVAVK